MGTQMAERKTARELIDTGTDERYVRRDEAADSRNRTMSVGRSGRMFGSPRGTRHARARATEATSDAAVERRGT